MGRCEWRRPDLRSVSGGMAERSVRAGVVGGTGQVLMVCERAAVGELLLLDYSFTHFYHTPTTLLLLLLRLLLRFLRLRMQLQHYYHYYCTCVESRSTVSFRSVMASICCALLEPWCSLYERYSTSSTCLWSGGKPSGGWKVGRWGGRARFAFGCGASRRTAIQVRQAIALSCTKLVGREFFGGGWDRGGWMVAGCLVGGRGQQLAPLLAQPLHTTNY